MIGVGGYASGPAMLAASLMNVPMMAFEPNVIPGIANRLVAPMVRAAAVHFPATQRYFRNAVVTGVPVRREFFHVPERSPDARPTLLVFRRQPGSARHQRGRHRVALPVGAGGAWNSSHPPDRRKAISKPRRLPHRTQAFPPKCRASSTTCRALSPVPTCWCVVLEPAQSQK